MIVNWCSASFLLLLSGCMGNIFGGEEPEFDIDNYEYEGDPIGISCVYNLSMTEFHQINVTRRSKISWSLVEHLDNGKPLILYVDGVFSILKKNGSTFKYVHEWANVSESNICYLTYAYEKNPTGYTAAFRVARTMVITHRLQYAAKIARDFVLMIRDHCVKSGAHGCWKDMSQVTMLGLSFGAHVASQVCVDLYQRTGQKVGKLIGIDPAGIYLTLKINNQKFIEQGDAKYVQIIHTDPIFFGTVFQSGDVDIYFKDLPVGIMHRHGFAAYLHMATAMKKMVIIGEKDGKGIVIPVLKNSDLPDHITLDDDEVIVGVYGELEESKRGQKFYVSLKNRFELLRSSIAQYVKIKIQ